MRKFFITGAFLCISSICLGQTLSSLRIKNIPLNNDTVVLDSLSIAPGTLRLMAGSQFLDTSSYIFDFQGSRIIWKKESPAYRAIQGDSIKISYRVFSFLLGREFRNKDFNQIAKGGSTVPFYYNPGPDQPEIFRVQGLTKNGSISRGISFGNNQDVFVNSTLNLQLAGKLSDNVDILAAITDENIPVQPEGNTQQLQDFDKVFIQLSNNRNKLIAGDFELRRPDSYFMNFFKKGQGGYFTTENQLTSQPDKKRLMRSAVSLAVSKGKFAKNTLAVQERNQGPYKMSGANGESFIIILSGTEKVFFDGIQMVRGSQNDYVIDYNTAEISFTARRLITKDSRIIVEFEYSEKNYSRTLIYLNNEFETERLKVKFNLYSEQDAKNQPLSSDLDSTQKQVMADAGDNVNLAVFPTADSVLFNSDAVLYAKRDTVIGLDSLSFYEYSTNPDSAYWQVSFSDVGIGNGDYVQDVSSANGRVFKFVGANLGNFAPVSLLITPKKQQMITTGVGYDFDKRNNLYVEGAYSNNDVNLFSSKDKENDAGYAAKITYKNETPLSSGSNGWKLLNVINYEYSAKNFQPIERYRNVEFERDWNLGVNTIKNDEHMSSLQTTLINPSKFTLTYLLNSYVKGADYKGLMNGGNANMRWKKFQALANASYLTTDGLSTRTKYLRHSADVSHPLWIFVLGVRENYERNKFNTLSSDTLLPNSFSFQELMGYVNTLDSSKTKVSMSYKRRIDKSPFTNILKNATKADEANLITEFSKNPDNTLRTTTTYRKLEIEDTLLSSLESAKTLLNRFDYILNIYNGIFSFNTYYEVGTGQERKLEYYYVHVNDGQGVYAYVGDDNGNGVQDLDEFAVAAFQEQANYIRVYVPTNESISTRSNQFNEVLVISPAGNRSRQGKERFIHRLSDQFSVRFDRKTKAESILSSLNPFNQNLDDEMLISANSGLRNTLYYNKNSPVFGLDITWQENRTKAFLTNGFETRTLRARIFNFRWNINRFVLATLNFENGDKINTSDYFSNRSYSIYSNGTEPRLSFQPQNNLRLTASYKYIDKKNTTGDIKERAISNRFLLEMKVTAVNSGNLTARAALIDVNYNASDDSFLAYEMLEGYKNGKNYTWGIAVQKTLNNSIQLSLSYDGRKLQDSPVVHTGGAQFRAFF